VPDSDKSRVTDNDTRAPHGALFTCPHCGYRQLVHIGAAQVVAIYKCPNCRKLVAPAKK
jgi:DNA-directed RNA polymerase subunit RPC12/RpoP